MLCASASGCAVDASARDLIVYYANESSPQGEEKSRYDELLRWLGEIATDKAKRVETQLRRDQSDFPSAVKNEIEALAKTAATIFVFTNALARQGLYQVKDGATRFSNRKFPLAFPEAQALALRSNPLSNPELFSSLMMWLADESQRLRPSKLAMVFKSHGNRLMALTPRVVLWPEISSKSKLEEILRSDRPLPRVGVLRDSFFRELAKFQERSRLPLDVVVLEACGSSDAVSQYRVGPWVKSFFVNSSEKAEYRSISYQDLWAQNSPVEALREHLRNNPAFREYRPEGIWAQILRMSLYFLPLLATTLLWLFMRQR